MSAYDDDILMMAAGMAVGDRIQHAVCPKCKGGDSRERSFMLWMDEDGVAYNCYRVKCKFHGKVGGARPGAGVVVRRTDTPADKLHLTPLPSSVFDWLVYHFQWMPYALPSIALMQWDARSERVMFPITGLRKDGRLEGWLARVYPQVQNRPHPSMPKARCFFYDTGSPSSGLMLPPHGRPVIDTLFVVEDYVSACRLGIDFPTVALSGTHIGAAAIDAILKANIKNMVMVLDSDAVSQAQLLCRDNSIFFRHMSYVALTGADVKDMDDIEYGDLKFQLGGIYESL